MLQPCTSRPVTRPPPSAVVLLLALLIALSARFIPAAAFSPALPSRRCFAPPPPLVAVAVPTAPPASLSMAESDDDAINVDFEDDDEYTPPREGEGPNWIEKSSPTGIGGSVKSSGGSEDGGGGGGVDDYSLGISGVSFDTGPLSKRMYDALISVAAKRFPAGTDVPTELADVYKLYSMDMTAKEATKAALSQNGLELVDLTMTEGLGDSVPTDISSWGEVEGIQLVDKHTGEDVQNQRYDTFDEAVGFGEWQPGQPFNFIVRNVPAKLKTMDLSDLLGQLDPDGSLRAEAKEAGHTMPDEDIISLRGLGDDCERRAEAVPQALEGEETVFSGGPSKGYRVMSRSDLLADSMNADGTENRATLMHLMDAMVNHGCLVVDLTDGGTTSKDALTVSGMWDATNHFFDTINTDLDAAQSLPPIGVAEGAGSTAAKVGFSSYDNGRMQFLESRVRRDDGAVLPKEVADIIGTGGTQAMKGAFDVIAAVGRDAVRIAVAAVNDDVGAFLPQSERGGQDNDDDDEAATTPDLPSISGLTFEEAEVSGVATGRQEPTTEEDTLRASIRSSEAAALLAEELMDDGRSIGFDDETGVSMSPHRMCRYSDVAREGDADSNGGAPSSGMSEIFGAHTDTSFITAVPVAAVSGLEVYDEEAERWFRPELLAREHWEDEREERDEDSSAVTETVVTSGGESVDVPWHSRYLVLMPGELMQLVTRNEVPAAVHRVVAVTNGKARLSAPALLRARSGMVMNTDRYLGRSESGRELLEECDGLKMEKIHDAMQPSSFQS